MARRSLRFSIPTHYTTGIERPRWVDGLPSHISKTVVSTVCGGGSSPWGRISLSASSPRRRSRTCARCLLGTSKEGVNFLLRVDFIPRSVLPPKVVVERP